MSDAPWLKVEEKRKMKGKVNTKPEHIRMKHI